MKHKVLKKTIIYRILAFVIAMAIGLFSPIPISVSIIFVIVSETVSLATYYLYEFLWERHINKKNLKLGMRMWLGESHDKYGWFNVIEVLEDGKIIIEVE